ncbi:MAG TPA: glycoside hydrolase family 27 protein, partial [Tepidisphaeraceae bacterium]|nr:glycoside hydrolase family 27 protein [Tepidisphaeraceae bacterium]
DFRWYDPGANSSDPKARAGADLTKDQFGRLTPATNRFPSAADNKGFKPLADKIHAMGLKFGIHVMRGIPRKSLEENTPIEGSPFHATDAANTNSICVWNPDMFGVNGTTPAGQAWYDSIVRQYASWDVDYIKVDDLSRPYYADEIEAIHRAIQKCGRPMILSTSPGDTPIAQSEHIKVNANLWRVSDDIWDRWPLLNHQFDLLARWQGQGGPDHWPDSDMIPFGHVAIRSGAAGPDRWTRFTHNEQITFFSMWAILPSPLMLGMNLPDNDDWTTSILTNDEILAINQDPFAAPAHLLTDQGPYEIWSKRLANNSYAVGFFNRSQAPKEMNIDLTRLGISHPQSVRDVWLHQDLGTHEKELRFTIPSHGAMLLRLSASASTQPN